MSSLNSCQFIGNLGRDVEVRYIPSGSAVADLAIACGYAYKDKNTGEKVEKTDWINVTAFGRLAEIMGEYLKKGSKVFIEGRQTTEKWQDKEGKDRYTTKIIANKMIMLDSRGQQDNHGQQSSAPQSQAAPARSAPIDNDFDDEIPF